MNRGLFSEAKKYIPGGVNSPVRAFKAVGGYPLFIRYGQGAKIYAESGRSYIDYCLGFGVLILGHAHPEINETLKVALDNGALFGTPTKLETEFAKVITEAVGSIEKVRLTNSGTEAVMTAIRLARAYTGRKRIVKFSGCYHGHADYLLQCPGVPDDFKRHTLTATYNDIGAIKKIIRRYKQDIAAIIIEPVCGNNGVILPKDNFLKELRSITRKHKIILIFDEVITGFRFLYGGAQEFFRIKPDLTCLGKIIGGGLPIGAVGGRKEIMRLLAPEGKVYQAGTFSGNPLSVSAGLTALKVLAKDNPYKRLQDLSWYFYAGIKRLADKYKVELKINFIGSMFSISLKKSFSRFYHGLLKEGVYFSPSPLEANFVSAAHTIKDIQDTLKAVEKVFRRD